MAPCPLVSLQVLMRISQSNTGFLGSYCWLSQYLSEPLEASGTDVVLQL